MNNADWILVAFIDLKLQVISNYNKTAKKHEIVYITLIKWYIKKIISNHEAITKHR